MSDPCGGRPEPTTAGLDVFLSGQVYMDMIFTGLPGPPPPGGEVITDGLGSAPGGVANMAVAMSRLGLRVGLAAAFGDDIFGTYLWDTLAEQENVDLAWSRRMPGWSSPVTVSLAYDADRSMVTYVNPLPPLAPVGAPPPARTCVIDIAQPVPPWAVELRAAGGLVVADLGWDPTETWSADVLDRLRHVDIFLPNAVEAMAYTRTSTPSAALEHLARLVPTVVVKRGAEGALAAHGRERAAEPALPVDALDPTGAGDVFCAAFVYGTLAGWGLPQRLRFANLCAGLSVRHYSGSLGAPCWGEIAAFGETGEVPGEVLENYAFVVEHIPDSELDRGPESVARAQPTLRGRQ
ncbi:sugar/nucleoside kinase (ribokinase family) [Actinocorallia herbida]|uniref:Sugar/nucleoside kinase (Ribokinase family) n=1 Tax=Actinocorallia herbida TaxID=58109 RepID=A0A3N1D8K9_9ACTN|nr:carbohydrate kinase family protein [Actinocorallia herbida]ROO89799.1 sugar/nucleoside kinase (ribokinase family) [Actinocorallia herbida]